MAACRVNWSLISAEPQRRSRGEGSTLPGTATRIGRKVEEFGSFFCTTARNDRNKRAAALPQLDGTPGTDVACHAEGFFKIGKRILVRVPTTEVGQPNETREFSTESAWKGPIELAMSPSTSAPKAEAQRRAQAASALGLARTMFVGSWDCGGLVRAQASPWQGPTA
jgi:hypothetical protein